MLQTVIKIGPTFSSWIIKALTNHKTISAFMEPAIQLFDPNWQSQGYHAKVIDHRKENEWVFTLVLQPQKNWPSFNAGQHIALQVEINGIRYTRIFSLSSPPSNFKDNRLIELTIRQQTKGKVTPWLANFLSKGAQVRISAAQGEFKLPELSPAEKQTILLIAGGSGITPFRSFIHHLADENKNQDIHLIYYNHGVQPLFNKEWQALAEVMPNLRVDFIDTTQQGRITKEQLTQLCPDYISRLIYLCGPLGLITTSRDILLKSGVKEAQIKHELFGPKPIKKLSHKTNGQVIFTRSKKQANSYPEKTSTLLELAEIKDINPISGCRMGVCHQCKCHKQQGVVYNTLTETYSDTGPEDIQLCVSLPVGAVSLDL